MWGNFEECDDLTRRIVFKATHRYWLRNTTLAECFNDLHQTAWVKLLELDATHHDAPKKSIIARIYYAVVDYLERQVFGWYPLSGSKGDDQKYRLLRFYQFFPEISNGDYDVDELSSILAGTTAPQVINAPRNPEEILSEEVQNIVFDQWKPHLENDLYLTIAASRLHRAPLQKLRPPTIRRHAFILTARLRGMTNVDIAVATGRHSDRTKARMRVGADVKSARSAINTWLALSTAERDMALDTLLHQYPTIEHEPLAYPVLDRDLLWGKPQIGA